MTKADREHSKLEGRVEDVTGYGSKEEGTQWMD